MSTKSELVNSFGSRSDFIHKEYANVKSDIILITEDKLRNILNDYFQKFKKAYDYLTPLSISLTILITFLTTEFSKDFLGISKSNWSFIFIICFAISILWMGKSLFFSVKYRKTIRIDNLVDRIKNKN
jgi:hypothetical protein